jgi:transposase
MSQNFLACDREQELLLPPSLREWLPENHLAWCVIDPVAELDLATFYSAYRADGCGRAAHEPAMMVALLLYAYAIGERSSRRIERHCEHDVAFRVIAANRVPDHATIARFRVRHERAIAGLFGDVLALCAEAGLVEVGVIAVDGTKVHANASQHATRDYEQIAAEILAEARPTPSTAEDERYGERRGDELPPAAGVLAAQGRREARRRLEERRAEEERPIPGPRPERLQEAKRRLEEEHRVECQANAAYEAYRARGRMKDGRRFGRPPDPHEPPAAPAGKVTLTDLDSRNVKTPRGWVQGYNAQAVCTQNQIVIAAEVTADSPDFGHLAPMITAAETELAAAGISEPLEIVLADAGYWHQVQIEQLTGRGTVVLIPPDASKRQGTRPGWDGGLYDFMRRVLATDHGGELYAKRKGMIEPVFGDAKFNRRCDRFQRRGRSAARSEWRLITATHNLLKLHRHQLATAVAPAGA